MEIKDLPTSDRSVATLACRAMAQGKRMKILYHPQGKDGEERLIEVHAVGLSTKGKPCMRVFQVGGGAVFGEHSGWKMLSVQDVDKAEIVNEASEGPRPGYSPGDKGMHAILAEISNDPVPQVQPEG